MEFRLAAAIVVAAFFVCVAVGVCVVVADVDYLHHRSSVKQPACWVEPGLVKLRSLRQTARHQCHWMPRCGYLPLPSSVGAAAVGAVCCFGAAG